MTTKAELEKELEQLRAKNVTLSALIDKDLTYQDLEAKFRDGTLNVKAVLGEGSQPVGRFLASLMLHWILGEGPQDPDEPPNYRSAEFTLTPGGTFHQLHGYIEVVKPGGKSSHKIREDLEQLLRDLRPSVEFANARELLDRIDEAVA